MGFLNRVRNAITAFQFSGKEEEVWTTMSEDFGNFLKANKGQESEITYYICMKVLSEAVGKLSIHLKDAENNKVTDHDAIQLLKNRPNPYMTPTDFKKLMEYKRNDCGNSYACLEWDRKGHLIGIHPLDPTRIKIIIDDAKILKAKSTYIYEYTFGKPGKQRTYYFKDSEILHLKGGLSDNGIVGKSILEELANVIKGAKASQEYLNNLYDRGLTANAVLKYTGELSEPKKRELTRSIASLVTDEGLGNVLPLPFGMDLIPLDLKLTDAQFFELKKFTSLQIAAAFGVKPNHLNNYEKSSYANSEMQNLLFYIDTLLVILSTWEEELNYKLLTQDERNRGLEFEFNVATILRGDLKTQAEALNKFVTGSVYTPNEARSYLGMPKKEGGDELMVNGTYTSIDRIGEAYNQGGENDNNSKEQ